MLALVPALAGLYWYASSEDEDTPDVWEVDPEDDPYGESRPLDLPEPEDPSSWVPGDADGNYVPDVIEDAVSRAGDLAEQAIDQIPEAAGRAAGTATGTLVITGGLTLGTLYLVWKVWK